MSGIDETTKRSKELWEQIANDWDAKMGDEDNRFHREIIRPATLRLLNPCADEHILDAACGNGNFSRSMARLGVRVTAFDYSETLIERARVRCKDYLDSIDFHIADATKYEDIVSLGDNFLFDKAVSNMAVMDISDIEPMFRAIFDLLKPHGVFVFSTVHPCFQTPNMRKISIVNDYSQNDNNDMRKIGIETFEYIKPKEHEVMALSRNNKRVMHFHRPLSELLSICFKCGFVLDGIEEPVFAVPEQAYDFDWYEIPPAVILRLRKE